MKSRLCFLTFPWLLVAAVAAGHAQAVLVQPTSVTFSSTLRVGVRGSPHDVSVTNNQATTLLIQNIATSPSDFAQTNDCGTSLAAGDSCDIMVVFTPTTTGTRTGTLTITDNAPGSPQVVPLRGGGVLTGLRSIAITAPNPTLAAGAHEQLTAIGTYSNGRTGNITAAAVWSSLSTGIANVGSNTGIATGVSGGSTTITATAGTPAVAGRLSLTVTHTLVSIAVTAPTYSISPGATDQFTATGTYSDGSSSPLPAASTTFATSNQAVASITNAGLATGVAGGMAQITATSGTVTSPPVQLTVTGATLQTITLTPASVSLGLNATQQYTATGTYSNGTISDITTLVTWTSGNISLVSITKTGLATVLGTSTTAIPITASLTNSAGTLITSAPAFLSALSTLPVVCPNPTIDMKLLVVNNAEANSGAGYADFPAIEQILNYVGTHYDVVDITAAPPTLSDGLCHGYYQGVIFAYGGDFYNISGWQAKLIAYEQTFKVRQVNWFDFPDPNFGLSPYAGNSIPSSSTYSASFTAAAAPIFFYANTAKPVSFSNAEIYLVPPSNAQGTTTPLITDNSGNALSVIITYADGRQYLTQTFDSNASLMHNLIVAYGLLNWVTKGVFLGDYHVYATQEVDDFFIDDSEWVPSTPCLSNPLTLDRTAPDAANLPVFRINSSDMAQLVAWQSAKQKDPLLSQFKLTLAFNGVGTAYNGDWTGLDAAVTSTSSTNGVATFTAPGLSALPGQQVTISSSTNAGGIFNGTWTILTVTSNTSTTPGSTIFTANVPGSGTVAQLAEDSASADIEDDLTDNVENYQGAFHWISHTYDHPATLNGLHKSDTGGDTANSPPVDDIDLEILTNLWVASSAGGVNLDTDPNNSGLSPLFFTDFNPENIVTPGITGLNDANVPTYLYEDGIRYAVSDTSVIGQANNGPNPSPNVGIVNSFAPGIYEIPRHPNDIFYNVANWSDDQAEFRCIYTYYVPPNSPPGTTPAPDPPFNTFNAAQILDFVSSSFVTNMLIGDMDPEMFHQPDLHFSDNYASLSAAPVPPSLTGIASPHVSSLITDTYDQTFAKYEAVYKLPVLTPTLDQIGVLMQNRNSFNLSDVTASIVGAGTASATISLSVPITAPPSSVIPVTGLLSNGSEVYGGQNISHITMVPGQTVTLPLK